MATISSPGLGSGLDVSSLVNQLVAAEAKAPTNRLDRREGTLQSRLSGYGKIKGAFAALNTALANISKASSFQSKTGKSSDESILTASAKSSAVEASYDVTVNNLATAHRLSTDPALAGAQFTSQTDVIGTGTLSFRFGTTDYDSGTDTYNGFTQNPDKPVQTVEITDGSLSGIRDAINEADIGVTASIIYDGSHYRLVLGADDTGAANSLQISVDDADLDDADAAGLSVLAFNDSATYLAQTQASGDASLNINGIDITSASNSLENTIDGLTINLADAGTSTITVAQNTSTISKNISAFVASYNALIGTINEQTRYNADSGQAGALNGDSVIRSLDGQIKRLISSPLTGTEGSFTILAEIGISRSPSDGTLVLDNTKLADAIKQDVDGVISLFAAHGKSTDPLIQYSDSDSTTLAGNYAVNITQLATQGSLAAGIAANLTITADVNDKLSLNVDGVTSTVTLPPGTYTAASLAAELQAQINGVENYQENDIAVTVSQNAGVLTITSNRYGSASKVELVGGSGATGLLGASPTAATGVDVAGTIGGYQAVGSGQTLTGTNAAAGLEILVAGGDLGDRGTLNFSRGYAEQLKGLMDGALASDGIFKGVEEGLNRQLERVEDDRQTLLRRLASTEERLRAQFTALDVLVSQLQNTSSYLQQQLASLPVIGSASNRNNS